jgi:hypothetical protein
MSNFRVLSEFIATQSKPPAIAVEANIGPRRTPKREIEPQQLPVFQFGISYKLSK